jgi:hypothetical protein
MTYSAPIEGETRSQQRRLRPWADYAGIVLTRLVRGPARSTWDGS